MIAILERMFTRKRPTTLPTPALIALAGVSRAFDDGAIVALKSVDLTIRAGECVAILGPSGSGKSSIVNLLSGIDRPSDGRVLWNGKAITSRRAWARLRRSEIGIVFQEFNLLPTLTARENVEIALMGRGIEAADRHELAETALTRVGLAHRIGHLPHALSGGERQRVAIARSIVNAPRLLLADEPTGNLDSANAEIVADLLFSLQRDGGMTLVLVTHDEELAARCLRCVRVRDGKIASDTVTAPAAAAVPPAAPVAQAVAAVAQAAAAATDGAPPEITAAPPIEPEPPIGEATAAIARAPAPPKASVAEAAE
jgi:putative ABC transport system ATP-binding protein